MKTYSLVGKKLVECSPDELKDQPVGMIVDEKEEMLRLIVTPEARKKQREYLLQESAELNKTKYAGTYLVSFLENPSIVKNFLEEVKKIQSGEIVEEPKEVREKPKPKKKGKKKKKSEEPEDEIIEETQILERWDPELVKNAVAYLDGKTFVHLQEIQEAIDTTEGEAYWLTQDLIHVGIVPGRWTGYPDGQWVYQVLTEQPLTKQPKPKKTSQKTESKKKTSKASTTAKKKSTSKKTTKK